MTKYVDKLNNRLTRGSKEQYEGSEGSKLQIWYVLRE